MKLREKAANELVEKNENRRKEDEETIREDRARRAKEEDPVPHGTVCCREVRTKERGRKSLLLHHTRPAPNDLRASNLKSRTYKTKETD